MPRLPVVSGDDFVRAMEQVGYVWDHTEGSHMILLHPSGKRLSVHRHKELGRGLFRRLLNDAGVTPQRLSRLLR